MEDRTKLASATLPTVERAINGAKYSVTRLGWWAMLDAVHRLEEIAGPALCSLLDADKVELGEILDSSGGAIGAAVTGLLRRATSPDGKDLLGVLVCQTVVSHEGRAVPLDLASADIWFAQRPGDMVPWLTLCMEVQFRDFFAPLLAVIGGSVRPVTARAMPSASSSPNT